MKGIVSEEELLSVLDKYDFEDTEFEGFDFEKEAENESDDDYRELD